MTESDPREQSAMSLGFGAYQIVRQLRPSTRTERYLVVDPERSTHHVAFRLPIPASCDRDRFLEAVSVSSRLDSPHALPIEQFAFAGGDAAWIISPYTGDHDGLLLLADLLSDKGGQFEPIEVSRALGQLIEAMRAVHAQCDAHGELSLRSVQIDRGGRLLVELPGLNLESTVSPEEARRQEIRSIVAIGYELLTGITPGEELIPPSRLVEGLPVGWDRFVAEGLDPASGYADADAIRAALDGVSEESPVVEVRTRRTSARMGFMRRRSGV